jgi:hypothetical protein
LEFAFLLVGPYLEDSAKLDSNFPNECAMNIAEATIHISIFQDITHFGIRITIEVTCTNYYDYI